MLDPAQGHPERGVELGHGARQDNRAPSRLPGHHRQAEAFSEGGHCGDVRRIGAELGRERLAREMAVRPVSRLQPRRAIRQGAGLTAAHQDAHLHSLVGIGRTQIDGLRDGCLVAPRQWTPGHGVLPPARYDGRR